MYNLMILKAYFDPYTRIYPGIRPQCPAMSLFLNRINGLYIAEFKAAMSRNVPQSIANSLISLGFLSRNVRALIQLRQHQANPLNSLIFLV